jgi:hypothetical protein
MRYAVLLFAFFALAVFSAAQAEETPVRDIYSDTWVATDALGRAMPEASEVGPLKTDQRRVVGIFYITWHSDNLAAAKSPYAADVSKVLAADPRARLDANHPLWTDSSYHWGEPELGYFLSKDPFVIRRDMSMLADAGVDVLIMDVTNAVCYWDEWEAVFSTMQKMKAEGNRVPQFCFWSFNGPAISVVQSLYEKIYRPRKYEDLWFQWDGKPLLLYNASPTVDANGSAPQNANPNYDPAAETDPKHPHYRDPDFSEKFYKDYTKEVKQFFTLRNIWWGYYEWAGRRFVGTEDNWSFGYDLGDDRVKQLKPDELASRHEGRKEESAVTPAQHPSSLVGKSWTREHGEPELDERDLPRPTLVPWLGKTIEHPEGYGIYFQERWNEALQADPQFLYLNDWNEWTAGKYDKSPTERVSFMRRGSDYQFIDQYNAEFNRAIQPMKGGYTDNYYMQMAENIRRYKGARPIPVLEGVTPIRIDGDFDQWRQVQVEYRDTIGDTIHRDYPGYGGLHYRDESGRNDIVACKVAVDDENVYFYVETAAPLTPPTGENWMLLLIDADKNHDTGWNGYDYLVNKNIPSETTTTLSRWQPEASDGRWVEQSQLTYRRDGNRFQIAVPRKLLGLSGDSFAFDFKWADNPKDLKDPISLCTSGDTAPNRRFNYRCIWKK